MSALSTSFVTNLLTHYFQNANHGNVGDATGLRSSTAPGSLYYALHTTDPGDGGSQSTGEVTYTGYARGAAARSSAGFTVSGKNVNPAAEVSFGKRTDAGSVTALFWSVGTAVSGAGNLILRGGIGGAPRPFTAAVTDVITCPGHGLAVDDRVVFWQYEGLALPAGIVEGTAYWVKTAPDPDTFTVSASQGWAALDVSAAAQGTCQRLTPLVISQNVTPKLETGTVIKFQ